MYREDKLKFGDMLLVIFLVGTAVICIFSALENSEVQRMQARDFIEKYEQAQQDIADMQKRLAAIERRQESYESSRGGDNEREYEIYECTAYAYNSGHTASGTVPLEGRTIAVDPEVIPLGSEVYIEGYGVRIAEDTGTYIKGKRLDIFIKDWDKAREFGRQKLKVRVLERRCNK